MKKLNFFLLSLFVGFNSFAASSVLNSIDLPNAPTILPVTIKNCENTTLNATGFGGSDINWYSLASGGKFLGTGSTTNYYANCINTSESSILSSNLNVTVNNGVSPITLGAIIPKYYCTNGVITIPFTSTLPAGTVFTVQFFQNGNLIQTASSQTSPISLQLDPNVAKTNFINSINIVAGEFSSLMSYDIYIENFSNVIIYDGILYSTGDVLCPGKSKKIFAKLLTNTQNIPVIYKWYKNEILIENTNDSSLTVSEAGSYKVKVGESCTKVSNNYPIQLATEVWGGSTRNSFSDIACDNTQIELIAHYYSNSATYQWQKNGINIVNATGRVFKANESGEYIVNVIEEGCQSTPQNVKLVFMNGITAPLTTSNGDTTLCGGNVISLFGINDVRGPKYNYSWTKDGIVIDNATSFNYNAFLPGKYQLTYYLGDCKSKSRIITLIKSTKAQKPVISAGNIPNICSGEVLIKQNINFDDLNLSNVELSGFWFKDGLPLQYTNSYFNATNTGTYYLVYGDGDCAVESNHVSVSTNSTSLLPKIILFNRPFSSNICGTKANVALSLDNNFIKLNNVSYQWQKDGININGNQSQIVISKPGNYSLLLNNGSCTGISNSINITANNDKINIVPTENNVFCTNRAVKLQINFWGYDINKQIVWKRDNVILPNETNDYIYALKGGVYTATINSSGCNATSPPFIFNADIPNYGFTTKSGNWNDPLCWICNQVPTTLTDAKVSNGHSINVPTGLHDVKTVKVEGNINIETGGQLKINN